MSWKFICPSNCPLVTSRPPPPSLPPSALIIRDRTLPFPSLRFHFRGVGVVKSGGEEEAAERIGTNFQDEEGTAAPSRDRLSSALSPLERSPPSKLPAERRGADAIQTSFLLCWKNHLPHRRRYGRKPATLLPTLLAYHRHFISPALYSRAPLCLA